MIKQKTHNLPALVKVLLTHCYMYFPFCVGARICVCGLKVEIILFCSLLSFT